MPILNKNMERRSFLRASAGAVAAMAAYEAVGAPKAFAASEDANGEVYDRVASDALVTEERGQWVPIHCHQNCNQM